MALAFALTVIVLEPFLFLGSFAGDAQVHLVFAESASHGRFFEFNPGERVSGETSPGYMLLGAAIFRLLPARYVPVALKAVGLVAWYLFCWLVYRIAARVLSRGEDQDPFWPAAAATAAAMIGGSVYNANVGMENGLFAAVIWIWLDLAERWSWFDRRDAPRTGQEAALGALLGTSFWLRPEAVIIGAVAFTFRLVVVRPPLRRWFVGPALAIAIGGGCLAFQYAFTGDIIATSILSRRVLAMRNQILIGPLALDPSFAERLLFYAPLTFLFLLGLRADDGPNRGLTRYLIWLFLASFAFYTLFGAPQLARYIIVIVPILTVLSARGARHWWRAGRDRRRTAVVVAALGLLAIDLIEPFYRRRHFSQYLLATAMSAPALRCEQTDDLRQDLGGATRRPVVLACESVQQRYELDERVIVRSLDGRTDRSLLAFLRDGKVDHTGYLKHIRANVLMKPTDYDRRAGTGQLSALDGVWPQKMTINDLSFRRLRSHGFAISEVSPEAAGSRL